MKTLLNLISKILIIGFLFGNCLAGTRNPDVDDTKYIEYGAKFECVLSIYGIEKDGGMFAASCVAINPEWVLTAAHVVKNAKHCGVSISESEIIIVDEIICHKDFQDVFGIGDIALCRLKKPLNMSFYPQLYSDTDEVGKVCSIAGFGATGTFITGQIDSDGKRRAGSNIIDGVEKDMLLCSPEISNITSLEFLIATGDSGGGLFIDGKLAGINSCVIATSKRPNSVYGDESGHTRISKFIPWIREKIGDK